MRISRAAADQRAGRAGRTAPGVAIRLWTTASHRALPAFDPPEILTAELSGLVLDCAAWGEKPADLPFPDRPPAAALTQAEALLMELGAMADGRITDLGRRMGRLGAHPRLSAMMLAAPDEARAALAATLAAILEERDPLRAVRDAPADIALRLDAVAGGAVAGGAMEADRGAVARIRRAAGQYRGRLRVPASACGGGDPAPLIAAGFPDRIAQRRGEPGSFRLAGGGGARLALSDPLSRARLLAVASLDIKVGARIRLAAPLDPATLPTALAARILESVETTFDPATGLVLARRRRRLGALVLDDRTEPADRATVAAALAGALALDALDWTDEARQLAARVGRMRALAADAAWPDLSLAALEATKGEWLPPYLHGLSRLADAKKVDVAAMLRGMLSWEQAASLDRALPTHLTLPGGRAAIDYTQPVPMAEARAQHFFGLDATPRLADGRVELRLALLSPAGRPVAITGDLPGFWRGAWAEVRRDMRGRYPRHHWPDHPATASAQR